MQVIEPKLLSQLSAKTHLPLIPGRGKRWTTFDREEEWLRDPPLALFSGLIAIVLTFISVFALHICYIADSACKYLFSSI